MKTAGYITTQTETGGTGKYPLSTQTLDFIQSQILLLQQLSLIGGNRFVLKEPKDNAPGAVVIDGEVLILSAKPERTTGTKYISVKTESQDIEADGEVYKEARTVRTASYSTTKTSECYELNTFNIDFATNTRLATQIKQMPETVLKYISDILAEKLSSLEITGLTQQKLDGIKTPCLISCKNSLNLFGPTNYCLMVRVMGDVVQQEITLQDNQKFVRTFSSGKWGKWGRTTENLHIEVKIVKGWVYLRHHYLPSDVSIILLRKKKRSKYRSTGGANSYAHNKGKRIGRSPKTQYVHFKGIVLSQGVAGQWYVPKCVSVADKDVDGDLIDKELPTLCRSIIKEKQLNIQLKDGKIEPVLGFRVQGLRNFVTDHNGRNMQHRGYASIAIQVARQNNNVNKDAGGEMVKLKYRISRKRTRKDGQSGALGDYIWYRSFSLE